VATVLYPGSFDPVHNGHIQLVETAASLFDHVVVAAMRNFGKSSPVFSNDERQSLLDRSFAHLPNVRTVMFDGLVVSLVKEEGIDFIIKGLRTSGDFEGELQMAHTNRASAGVETVFVPTTPHHSYLSSRYIREIARFGGDVSSMVPEVVLTELAQKFPPPIENS